MGQDDVRPNIKDRLIGVRSLRSGYISPRKWPFPGKGWSFLKCIARSFWLIFVIAHEMVNDFCHWACYFKNFIYRLV